MRDRTVDFVCGVLFFGIVVIAETVAWALSRIEA